MLYPKVTNINKKNQLIKWLIALSVLVGVICVLINQIVDKQLHWSFLCIAGIVYAWITVLYSLKKNVNIASHVLIQAISASLLMVAIDKIIGYQGWSIEIAIPIIITIANSTMAILAIVSHKRYARYVVYQIGIFLFSLLPVFLVMMKIQNINPPIIIATLIALITFIITIAICGKPIFQEMNKRFHI